MSTSNPQRDDPARRQSVDATSVPLPPTATGPLPEVFGRYRVIRLLGRGAMGAVYLANDTQLSRQVAIKVPRFNGDGADDLLERFYREARLAATLRNPYICPVYDVGEIEGLHYISMAYIEGKPLSELIKSGGTQKERASLLLVRKLAIALEEAHSAGIIHRDLKPANVMIDARGEPVVMDFGLALQSQDDRSRLTHSGTVLGSPAYMSPEQLEQHSRDLTPASDQFSLGVVLYELLTGELPFRGSVSAVANQIVNKPAPSPRRLRSELDPRTEKLCLRLLAKRASDRFRSMKDVAEHIAAILKSDAASHPLPEEPVATTASTSHPASDSTPTAASFRKQVEKLLSWGELTSALETLESPGIKLTGDEAAWIRQKRIEIRGQIEHWNDEIPAQCRVGRQLISKHDYGEAAKVLSVVPVGVRNAELSSLLTDAQEKAEEVEQLLKSIEQAFRTGTDDELKSLVKRFLQLKPGHQQMKRLAEDLKKYGPEQVIRQRRKQRNFFDPVGKLWEPRHFAYYGVGLGVACILLYCATIVFQAPTGVVEIQVLDPALAIDFSNTQVSEASSVQTFRLKPGDKQMLAVRLGGELVPEATQELSVERNETKRVQARVVDGKVELKISTETKVFSAPARTAIAAGIAGGGFAPQPPLARAAGWTDLLASVDSAKAGSSIMAWDRVNGILTGKPKPGVNLAWVALTPPVDFGGDYDLEVDFLVEGSDYYSLAFPLNETTLGLSLSPSGGGLQWVDGKKFTPPESKTEPALRSGKIQKLSLSVRHAGENVTVSAILDGRSVAQFSGARSRLAIPKEAIPAPNKLRIVSPISNPTPTSRLEIRRAGLKRLPASSTTSLANTPGPAPPAAVSPAPPQATGDYVIDADFRKSLGGFSQADQDFILEQHKDGEFRYLGKKAGWWYAPFHRVLFADENNQLKEFAVEFDIRLASSKRGEFAVEFGRIGDETFSLCFNQNAEIRLLQGGTDLIPPAKSPAMKSPDQFNTVRMVVEDDTAKVAVNGAPLFQKKLDHFGARHLVAWLHVDEYPFDVRLQRFRLERLGDPGSRQFDGALRRFEGHVSAIRGVAFLPDGKRAVSVANDHGFKLWNVADGQLVHDFPGHTAPVTSVSVSGDGKRALTGCDDGQIRLWDLETRQLMKALKGHTAAVSSVLISKPGLIGFSASHDGTIRRWDLKSFSKPAVLPGPGGEATLTYSPDESLVAAGSMDGSIVMRGPKAAGSLLGHDPGPIRGMTFTPDGSKLVAAGCLSTVRVWDVANGKQIHTFDSHDTGFSSVAVTADGKFVVAGCRDFTIRCWNLETGDEVSRLRAALPVTHRLALSPDNEFILTGGGDGANRGDFALRLWRLPSPPAPR